MHTRKNRIAALLVLIFLVVPLAAFAGHDHDDGDQQDQDQPENHHDNGRHNGWHKHHHHGDGDDDSAPPPQSTFQGRRDCDSNGDNCHTIAPEPMVRPNRENRYVCDNDRDECHWTNGGDSDYWRNNGGYNYGAPYSWYEDHPPSTYNTAQRRDWLISRRKHAMVTIKHMRERGDSKAAGRMATAVQVLDRQINALDRELRQGY